MYLFIFEDGELGKAESYDDESILAVQDGILDIVDMESGKVMTMKGFKEIEDITVRHSLID